MVEIPSFQEMDKILNSESFSFYPLKPKKSSFSTQFKRPIPVEPFYYSNCPSCGSDSTVRIETAHHGFTKRHILICKNTHIITRTKYFHNPLKTGRFKPQPVNDDPLF